MTGGKAPKRKGSAYERQIVAYLQAHGYPHAERKLAGKTDDTGDIEGGPPGLTLELKSHARWALAKWMDEAELESEHSGTDCGVVVVRRSGTTERGRDY